MNASEQPTDATTKNRADWRTARTVVVVGVCFLLLIPCLPFVLIGVDVYRSGQERHRLRYETDHHALLAASRQLMRDFAGQDIDDPETDPRVPQIIRDLGPTHMTISSDQLSVELHGGFDHYGFVAYADDSEPGEGWEKLIDGLRYYSE